MVTQTYTPVRVSIVRQRTIITQMYVLMAAGLLVTGAVAAIAAATPPVRAMVLGNMPVFYVLLIAELALVWLLSATIHRLSASVASGMFFLYAMLNGFTLSYIFLVYTTGSIAATFIVSAGMFSTMAFYGYTTKRDLTSFGNLAVMGLIGIVLGSIANIYLASSLLYWLVTYAGVLIFVALVAWDTQRLKTLAQQAGTDGLPYQTAIIGALMLYLDFLNLYLFLLRILGRKR